MTDEQITILIHVRACDLAEDGIELEVGRKEWADMTEDQRDKVIQETVNESGMVDIWTTDPANDPQK